MCWQRAIETITARKDDLAGLAIASDERIEASILHTHDGEIVWLRSLEDEGARLRQLIAGLHARGLRTLRFPKVHPGEASRESLGRIGFLPVGGHRRYAATAQSH